MGATHFVPADKCEETCAHVTRCPEAGRAEAFSQMNENETHPDLASVITEYARKRGDTSCIKCASDLPPIMREFAISQDKIG